MVRVPERQEREGIQGGYKHSMMETNHPQG